MKNAILLVVQVLIVIFFQLGCQQKRNIDDVNEILKEKIHAELTPRSALIKYDEDVAIRDYTESYEVNLSEADYVKLLVIAQKHPNCHRCEKGWQWVFTGDNTAFVFIILGDNRKLFVEFGKT